METADVPSANTPPGNDDRERLVVAGSSTMLAAIEPFAREFANLTGWKVELRGGGGVAGLEQVANGRADVGMALATAGGKIPTGVESLTLARDALVVIAHQSVPLEDASKELLAKIYSGEIRSWPGKSGNLKIHAVSRSPERLSRAQFEKYLHGGESAGSRPTAPGNLAPLEAGANLEVLLLVGGLPGAVGYVSEHDARAAIRAGMPIKILSLEGVTPGPETISAGRYPLVREWKLLHKPENPGARMFLEFFLERWKAEPNRVESLFGDSPGPAAPSPEAP